MSKQRNDQQPQSASTPGSASADGENRLTGQDESASSPAASRDSEGQTPANPSSGDGTPGTDAIKPDVTQTGAAQSDTSQSGQSPSDQSPSDQSPSDQSPSDQSQAGPAGETATRQSGAAPAKGPGRGKSRASSRSRGKSAAASATGAAAATRASDTQPPSGAQSSSGAKASSSRPSASGAASASTTSSPKASSGPGSSASQAGDAGGSRAGDSRAGGGGTKKRGGSGGDGKLGLVALILVILLAIAAVVFGYWGWQQLNQQQARLEQMNTNRSAIGELQSRIDDLDQSRGQALSTMRGEFDQYRQSLDDTLDRVLEELAQQQEADPREWLHAEAEYLLRLANQRLQLERDVNGAKALLNSADERLREADNPALVPVRRAIQSELAALDSVPSIDRTGIYLTLMAQQEQLARLPLKQEIEEVAAGEADTQPSGGWRQQMAILGNELKDLVTVRRHDQPLEAMITPEQESYLRQNVRLLLEQSQLALLKSEPELYQASLDKARELVEGYYATDDDGVSSVLEKLAELRDNDVRPELPDISESSQLLKQFVEQRFGGDNSGQNSQGGAAQGDAE